MSDEKTTKPKISEDARRIIEALVNTPPMKKPEPRKQGRTGQPHTVNGAF